MNSAECSSMSWGFRVMQCLDLLPVTESTLSLQDKASCSVRQHGSWDKMTSSCVRQSRQGQALNGTNQMRLHCQTPDKSLCLHFNIRLTFRKKNANKLYGMNSWCNSTWHPLFLHPAWTYADASSSRLGKKGAYTLTRADCFYDGPTLDQQPPHFI